MSNARNISKAESRFVNASGDTITGNLEIGSGQDISPSATADGQLKVNGNGYDAYIALNADAVHFGHNSAGRSLNLQVNETNVLMLNSDQTVRTIEDFVVGRVLYGGIGAASTGGVQNWNDVSNARAGQGFCLLLGSHANGPGPSNYFHAFTFEYSSKDGSGNMTQWAIGYNVNARYQRNRYGGTWSSWSAF